MAEERRKNHLAEEKSPYLLQHVYNPVDWYPWGEEAFKKAKTEDKPILLSIGYSTCHWCHVMEKESYNDEEVAGMLNRVFVCIKVDREERPDIDSAYMEVCQKVNGNCGWPLNVFMTPGKKPFFIATYIPKSNSLGMEGLMELAEKVESVWKTERAVLEEDADSIIKRISESKSAPRGMPLDTVALRMGYEHLLQMYDQKNPGFGRAPKFPSPHLLTYLLRYWKRFHDDEALRMVEDTLQAMRRGGIYDQIGGGFHRYSTDAEWVVPHFEKMLYDQALISIAYIEAYQATGKEEYRNTARDTLDFVLKELRSDEGAFYSAIDADSEGEEGKYYTWTYAEMADLLGKSAVSIGAYNVTEEGNFSEMAARSSSKHYNPANILYVKKGAQEPPEAERKKLLQSREKRMRPSTDDKILTDLNGLMIAALSRGSQAFGEKRYSEAAAKAASFIMKKALKSGVLYHRYREGETAIPGFLDDYSFFIFGLTELYEATFGIEYLKEAIQLNKVLIENFWDAKGFGFNQQSKNSEKLILSKKEAYDGAVPSGNSIEMLNLLRLGHITGDLKLFDIAAKLESAFSAQVSMGPGSFAQFLSGVDYRIGPSYEIVVVEGSNREAKNMMLEMIMGRFLPNKVVLVKTDGGAAALASVADFTRDLKASGGKTTACVCSNYACKMPTTDPEQMMKLIEG